MKWNEMYNQKRVSLEEAASKIKCADVIFTNASAGHPDMLIAAIAEHLKKHDIKNVTFHSFLALTPVVINDADFAKGLDLKVVSWFVGPAQRAGIKQGWITHLACHFHQVPRLVKDNIDLNVFTADVSPMDEEGFFSLGTAVSIGRALLEKADISILQVNEHQPYVYGDTRIHISEVDFLVEANKPLPNLSDPPMSEEDIKVGQFIADLIEDGSTLQIGIGGMPSAVAMNLKDKKDLGVHSEMLSDWMVDLFQSGVITGRRKTLHPRIMIGSFCQGSEKIYNFVNRNHIVEFYPVDYSNDPAVIAKKYKQISINAALEVDLTGQVCSESIGPIQYSGAGGQLDFTRGAYNSPGGKAFLCLHSTAKNGTVSRVVPMLKLGAIVTTPRTDVHYVVTEYGVAMLKGKSTNQRAKELIAIAAPQFREELKTEAKKIGLI